MHEVAPSPLQYRAISLAEGWEAYLVDAPPAPAEGDASDVLRALCSGLRLIAERGWKLTGSTFLQLWKIAVDGNAGIYEENISRWQPSVGLGVWPHRAPPRRMNSDMAMDHAAALITGEEPEISAYHLSHVSAGPEAGQHAEQALVGRGMLLEIFSAKPLAATMRASRELFLPLIADPAYRTFPFYLPLLDTRTLAGASAEEMEQWMCGADVYLRESAEDGGLLIVSNKSLRNIMDRAATMMGEANERRAALSNLAERR